MQAAYSTPDAACPASQSSRETRHTLVILNPIKWGEIANISLFT